MKKPIVIGAAIASLGLGAVPVIVFADEPATPPAEAPASTAMTTPSMAGPLVANPDPFKLDAGPFGSVFVTGAVTGLGMVQGNAFAGDHDRIDISNGLVALQNTEGLVQFFVQAGIYSFPALGVPYLSADRTTGDFFSPLPVAYVKLAPNDAFSVQAGKLPTLIGAEYGFSFQNMNIERGLLWNQEPIVSRGVQANYTAGPLALSASLNDGFYSDSYNWLTGSAAYTINKENTLTVVAGGNFDHTSKNVLPKSPFFYNNSDIFNVIYAYSAAPWTVTPYFQYTHAPGNPFLGAVHGNDTVGAAILGSYAINDNITLAGRFEYIGSTGDALSANLLYGPRSSAWSFTLTPTYQQGIFFVRAEGSIVNASSITPGLAFGRNGNNTTQARFLIETGIVF